MKVIWFLLILFFILFLVISHISNQGTKACREFAESMRAVESHIDRSGYCIVVMPDHTVRMQ